MLTYDIRSRLMLCDSCHGMWHVNELKDEGERKDQGTLDTVEYLCPSCGASVHSSQTTATSFCSFCGSEVVLTERLSSMRRPDRILPFRVTREECENIYRNKIKNSPYAPDFLLEQETIDHFRPVYIPYWRYSFHAEGVTEATGLKKYSDLSYNYVDTYDFRLSCAVTVSHMIYDASTAFEDETAQKLNFITSESSALSLDDKDATLPFHPAYLCGMYAEAPDAEPVIYEDHLEPMAKDELTAAACISTGTNITIPMPEKRTADVQLLLLPVWLLANRQGGRVLYTAVNGSSGNIVCETPVSNKRFARLTAGLFAIFLVIMLILSYIAILRPNLLLAACSILAVAAMRMIVPAADKILRRRQRDTDPTRAMKKNASKAGKDSSITNSKETKEMLRSVKKIKEPQAPSAKVWQVPLLTIIIGLIVFAFISTYLGEYNTSRLLNLLISDRGILVPIVLIVCLIFLFVTRYRYRNEPVDEGRKAAGPMDSFLLHLMRGLMAAGLIVSITHVPGISQWYYALSILILLLLIANILRVFWLHNEYVTRPVPFFGKEVQE